MECKLTLILLTEMATFWGKISFYKIITCKQTYNLNDLPEANGPCSLAYMTNST